MKKEPEHKEEKAKCEKCGGCNIHYKYGCLDCKDNEEAVIPETNKPEDLNTKAEYKISMDEILLEINKLPEDIRSEERKILQLEMFMIESERRLKSLEYGFYIEVFNEKTKEGKNKFSNDKLRDIEVTKIMSQNLECIDIQTNRDEKLLKLKESRIEFEYLNKKFRVLRYTIEGLQVKYRMI